MARPRSFNENQVLERAIDVFRRKGFDGTSIPELTAELGICRQSLYNTFGDKHGLFLSALEYWGQREVDSKLALLKADGSHLENLRTVIRGWAALAPQCPGEGCLTVTAIIVNRDDPEALLAVENQVNRLEQGFQESLEEAQRAGELKPDANAPRIARALITSYYGLGLLSRLSSSGARIGDSVATMLEMIDNAATPRS
ncbi:MAG: TetR/AcrR family transcriptional repressor of nem operon [Planctomycetota bacterium]|jgi:TetR/AcrR family transcriptional repressor of nem operon